jgi:NADH pyrophosphatase NudC (nudix superfamily)
LADVQNPAISLQPDEVVDAKWCTLDEAQLLPMFDQMRGVLRKISSML